MNDLQGSWEIASIHSEPGRTAIRDTFILSQERKFGVTSNTHWIQATEVSTSQFREVTNGR